MCMRRGVEWASGAHGVVCVVSGVCFVRDADARGRTSAMAAHSFWRTSADPAKPCLLLTQNFGQSACARGRPGGALGTEMFPGQGS